MQADNTEQDRNPDDGTYMQKIQTTTILEAVQELDYPTVRKIQREVGHEVRSTIQKRLANLERQGLLNGSKVDESQRTSVRIYKLTEAGEEELAREADA